MKKIIIDNLEWQAEDDGIQRTWKEAMEYASSLGDRWRLPTIKELISLIDFTTHNPACSKIEDCRSSYYWSSSPYAIYSSYAWNINFYNGNVGNYNKGYHYYARCVRDTLIKMQYK